ncbi:MAG: FtsQ-type POTRA domain-containing protein [Chlorobium sp.]|nr:MAG: FtsQ-type POTRA domain-containing protein [Chlorobium sp.]
MHDSEYQEYSADVPEEELEQDDVVPVSAASHWLALFFIFLLVFAALGGLVKVASEWKKELVVRGFTVDGSSIIEKGEVLLRIAGYKGRNLLELDANNLKKKIEPLSYLREAVISKELNGIVRVRIFEREPVAFTVLDGQKSVIDREGFLLPWKPAVGVRFPKLLEITGINRLKAARNGLRQLDSRDVALILSFLEALSETDYASMLIRELHLEGNNMSWCIAVRAPTRFIVGNDGNFKEKLKKFEIFWQKVVSKKGFGFYDTVDLRFRERIFTRDMVLPEVPQGVSQ